MEHNRNCIVCGKAYYHCGHCKDSDAQSVWRNIYDTEECRKIFDICSAYVNKNMSKGDAIIKLKSFKLPDHLKDKYQGIVDEILYVEKPTIKRKKTRIIQTKNEAGDKK